MGQRGPAGLLDVLKKGEICAVLASGGSQADAAAYVGCSAGTIRNTAQRDPAFAADLQRARAVCSAECLQRISTAGAKSWRAAAWILERTQPERYERVNLRQASVKQLNGFWRSCGDELLAGLPPEQQALLRQRFKQVAKGYTARPFDNFGLGDDDAYSAAIEDEADADDLASQISDFCEVPEAASLDPLVAAAWEPEILNAEFAAAETPEFAGPYSESMYPRSGPAERPDSEIFAAESSHPDRLAAAPSAGLWSTVAAAVLLAISLLWGSFAQPAGRMRGLACSAAPSAQSCPQPAESIAKNLARFPPSASRFCRKVSLVGHAATGGNQDGATNVAPSAGINPAAREQPLAWRIEVRILSHLLVQLVPLALCVQQ